MRRLLLGVVLLQVGVPAAMLVDRWADEGLEPRSERPASFQMYSAVERPAYVGVTAGGPRPLSLAALPLAVRAVGTGRLVPDRLCALHPDLVAVRRTAGVERGTYRC